MGQAAFGASVLESLLKAGHEVAAVYTPKPKPGAKPDPLQLAAENRRIQVHQPQSYKQPEALAEFESLQGELLVMAFVTDIIPAAFFSATSLGAICYHPSILPRHRGGSAINWTLIMGDTEAGLTIFWTDGGIDTGPILLQKRVPIAPEDTTGSIYFNKLFPMGVEAITESVALIEAGKAPRIVQDESLATYEPLCNDKVAMIDWGKPAAEVFNLIRGCDPQPGAYTFYRGGKVRLFDVRHVEVPSGARPGEVVAVDGEGITVAAGDGAIRFAKVRTDAGKQDAAAFADQAGIKPGDHFTAG